MDKDLSIYFSEVEDPRVVGRCSHLLSDILMVSLLTYLTGGTDYQDMHMFAQERGLEFEGMLQLPNGAPWVDTFERVFKKLKSESLQSCLNLYGKEILESLSEKQIVLDGKKFRGVSPHSKGNSGLYVLNAWVSENRFCIGQEKVEEKSNEITAIPKVLESLDIEEAVVSIDAIGTQTKIAEQIIEQGGHYFLSVKGNQQGLLEDMESAFKVNKGLQFIDEPQSNHGRIENRCCSILPASDYLLEENMSAWKNVSTLIKVDSSREIKGVIQQETRYYISDETVSNPSYYLSLSRGHWGIENQLHWHLDVTFKEDACRARLGNAPINLSTLRKFALQLLSNQKDKFSLKKRQYKAALDVNYLKKIINF
jgi:predicted transposase YbfD/YdcC